MMATIPTTDAMADLRNLESLSKKLNDATEQVNASLQQVQEKLNGMGLGLEVWLDDQIHSSAWDELRTKDDEPSDVRERTVTELGYGRLHQEWALILRDGREIEQPPDGYGDRRRET